jgi:hypothetical protein
MRARAARMAKMRFDGISYNTIFFRGELVNLYFSFCSRVFFLRRLLVTMIAEMRPMPNPICGTISFYGLSGILLSYY